MHNFKGRDRLCDIFKLKMPFCREKPKDSFDINETFLPVVSISRRNVSLRSYLKIVQQICHIGIKSAQLAQIGYKPVTPFKS